LYSSYDTTVFQNKGHFYLTKLNLKMKKKYTKSIVYFVMIVSFCSSCQRKPKTDQKIIPTTVNLSGDLSNYLQVVKGSYEVSSPYALNLDLSIRIKALKPINLSDIDNKDISLTAVIYDNSGAPIPGIQFYSDSDDQLLTLLKKGSGEEVIQFSSTLLQDLDFNNIKSFSVSSTVKAKEKEVTPSQNSNSSQDTSSITDNDNTTNASESKNDYDQLLDSYEKNTNDYLKVVRSMQKNDAGAVMDNYTELVQSSLDLQQKLVTVKSRLTNKQANRLMKIELKLANAMAKANNQK